MNARACKGTTRKDTPCEAKPLKAGSVIEGVTVNGNHCRAHDPDLPDSARFGSRAQAKEAAKLGGRPPMPKPTEVARQLVERHVYAVLRPHFKALGLELEDDGSVTPMTLGAVLTGESKDGIVIASKIEDLGAQIAAAEKLLDRVYGRPKQSTEISGPDGGPVEMVPVAQDRGDQVARILGGTRAVPVLIANGNGNGHPSSN